MECQHYFVFNGEKLGAGTKIQFNFDFYKRNARHNLFAGFPYSKPKPSVFRYIITSNGKTTWWFDNCSTDDLALDRDVESITEFVHYIEKTDKDRINEKKEQGEVGKYIWPGTIIYIFSMIFIAIFNERLWGWIAATIIYQNYCYSKLSK